MGQIQTKNIIGTVTYVFVFNLFCETHYIYCMEIFVEELESRLYVILS